MVEVRSTHSIRLGIPSTQQPSSSCVTRVLTCHFNDDVVHSKASSDSYWRLFWLVPCISQPIFSVLRFCWNVHVLHGARRDQLPSTGYVWQAAAEHCLHGGSHHVHRIDTVADGGAHSNPTHCGHAGRVCWFDRTKSISKRKLNCKGSGVCSSLCGFAGLLCT